MYKVLLPILSLVFLSTACTQQTRGAYPQRAHSTHTVPYSLEALDARYNKAY